MFSKAKLRGLLAATALATVAAGSAVAQDVTLIVHHFLPPVANAHKVMLEPWAEKVMEESDGRIDIQIYPSMSMGGTPAELYGQVRDGTADIVWTLLGYTPGVFPRSEVFELPTVHKGSARDTTIALNASLDLLAEDFKDVHVLFLQANDGNLIHSANREVTTYEDVAGMKLRTPSRTGAWLIEEIGAEPVSLPVNAIPESMSKGVIDGAMTTYEIAPALKLQELDKYTAELPDGDRFGTAVFMVAMNKDVYEDLPDDLKAVIDNNSRMNVAEEIGTMWETFEEPGISALDEAGVVRNTFSEEEAAKFDAAGERVVERWIEEVSAKGIDGAALVEAARAAVAEAHGE
ncbi:TRAP transporter substrate-binding protein [Celeribacter indicus]|uniref:TRAP dicarboxylate transporter subunit DctP n=1 Tax=Celeribacter indicus TaxID=1208324 RepID=A0A0B5DYE3_9RHOB|nr:TRAP transporter substrate-binding protein [Celeribacter indicus]AJE46175.1 TRAP dicarboxylate transporter subunit DctP [Celeribacter indicus]SDW49062.1 TRAP-type C4-dicarboxylate transport system, substrate-binding protein [Celeribacter indicus]